MIDRARDLLRDVLRTLVYGNVIVALAAASLTLATQLFLDLGVSAHVLMLAAAGTLAVYTLDRLFAPSPEDDVNVPARVLFYERHRRALIVLACVSGLVAVASAARLRAEVWAPIAPLALLVVAYARPILGRRLKDVPGLKPIVIGVCWASGSVLVPVLHAGHAVDATVLGVLAFRTLFLSAAALAFDVRDIEGDGARSLAARLGAARTTRLCRAVLALAALLPCVAVALGAAHVSALAACVVIAVLLLALRAERIADELYLGLVVDGALVVPGAVALVLHAAGLTPLL